MMITAIRSGAGLMVVLALVLVLAGCGPPRPKLPTEDAFVAVTRDQLSRLEQRWWPVVEPALGLTRSERLAEDHQSVVLHWVDADTLRIETRSGDQAVSAVVVHARLVDGCVETVIGRDWQGLPPLIWWSGGVVEHWSFRRQGGLLSQQQHWGAARLLGIPFLTGGFYGFGHQGDVVAWRASPPTPPPPPPAEPADRTTWP